MFNRLVQNGTFSGTLLILAAILSLIWANSAYGQAYFDLWQNKFTIGFDDARISKPLILWINDGLMAVFFFVIGLEIKREIMVGELSTLKKAALPMFAAIGGMVVPASIYVFFNVGKESISGWGIPMATDIAFSLGILALLGKRVPLSLKIFLTALAIVDDIGAVLVIAIFYSSKLSFVNLGIGVALLALMAIMNRMGVRNMLAYGLIGIAGVWLAFLLSGVHATIAGILIAITIPARTKIDSDEFAERLDDLTDQLKEAEAKKDAALLTPVQQDILLEVKESCSHYEAPLQSLEHSLHPWVAYLILPVFALSNAGVMISGDMTSVVKHSVSLGIILGLMLGKPLGVFLFSWVAVKLGLATLPDKSNWTQLAGIGMLAGVGFTMSLFITSLAFTNPGFETAAKIGILFGSFVSGVAGYLFLRWSLKPDSAN